jgi:hypothetical protein
MRASESDLNQALSRAPDFWTNFTLTYVQGVRSFSAENPIVFLAG